MQTGVHRCETPHANIICHHPSAIANQNAPAQSWQVTQGSLTKLSILTLHPYWDAMLQNLPLVHRKCSSKMPVTRAKKTTTNASLFGTNQDTPTGKLRRIMYAVCFLLPGRSSHPLNPPLTIADVSMTDNSRSTQHATAEALGVPTRASKRRKIENATSELAAPEAQDEEDGPETKPGSLENWRVQLAQSAAAVRPHEKRVQGPTFAKSGSRMKVESLPILDNLSTQVLSTFAKLSLKDILLLVGNPDSEHGQEYFAIKSLFDATKKVYTNDRSFLWPEELDLDEPYGSEVLRKANLATFVATLFEPSHIEFAELDAHFLRIFVPDSGRILKAPASIFLELKTQAFIASRASPEGATEKVRARVSIA